MILISYVFHKKNNLNDFKCFIKSVALYPPPAKSTILVISVKGCSDLRIRKMKKIIKKISLPIQVKFHELIDFGYANGTNYLINEIYKPKIIICMTATSQFNNENWFNALTLPLNNSKVGIVGSMLSYVSLKTNYYELMETIVKNKLRIKLTEHQKIVGIVNGVKFNKVLFNFGRYDTWFVKFLVSQIYKLHNKKYPASHRDFFPDFPNPHLRTTGFAIRGSDLNKVITRVPEHKSDEYLLESGHDGYSNKLKRLGFQVLVFSTDRGYLNIFDTNTFYLYEEFLANSIVIDGPVRQHQKLSMKKRMLIQYLLRTKRNRSFLLSNE